MTTPLSPPTAKPPQPLDVTVAAVQMVSSEEVEHNLLMAEEAVVRLANSGVGLILLPEFFPGLLRQSGPPPFAEKIGDGVLQNWASRLAERLGIWLCPGTIPLATSQSTKVSNSMLLYNDHGEQVARYDKMHLFCFQHGDERYDEGEHINPGNEAVAVDTPFGRIGMAICYDLRFPELFRKLGEQAPLDLLLLPAAFTVLTGRAHWQTLLLARAIENQCYLLAAAQGGEHACGRRTYGHSQFIDPWGEVLDLKQHGYGWVSGQVSHARIDSIRRKLPALTHRRLR